MDFHTWLKDWLARHPLREPRELDRASYTAEVMRTITEEAPRPVPIGRWLARLRQGFGGQAWPRFAMALAATVAGALLIVLSTAHRPMMLAESTSADETWIKETTQLLDQLDDESSKADANATSDEEWLKELQTFDERNPGSNS